MRRNHDLLTVHRRRKRPWRSGDSGDSPPALLPATGVESLRRPGVTLGGPPPGQTEAPPGRLRRGDALRRLPRAAPGYPPSEGCSPSNAPARSFQTQQIDSQCLTGDRASLVAASPEVPRALRHPSSSSSPPPWTDRKISFTATQTRSHRAPSSACSRGPQGNPCPGRARQVL
jgi:hypothetical protein